MKYLITGCAGFIGFHIVKHLIKNKNLVIGIDNLNKYYDYKLKKDRLNQLKNKNFKFFKFDLSNKKKLKKIFKDHKFDFIIQSFTSPTIYEKEMNSNLFDICCYHPFDIWWKSYSFFKRIKPDIYCITRHDIWPIHLFMLNFFKIKSIYINVNIHDNSLWVKPYIRKYQK